MRNLSKIDVYFPRLDKHDNEMSISFRKIKETKGNVGYILDGMPLVSVFETMFENEFEKLQEKYQNLVKETFINLFFDVDDLKEFATDEFIPLKNIHLKENE